MPDDKKLHVDISYHRNLAVELYSAAKKCMFMSKALKILSAFFTQHHFLLTRYGL